MQGVLLAMISFGDITKSRQIYLPAEKSGRRHMPKPLKLKVSTYMKTDSQHDESGGPPSHASSPWLCP
ncbi:hypothetical protein RRF57_010956 [Xylaria bambusicola]|uniref:Uncharacterized protein n=1 Tax=Xylaria bambusicola TaxID=326684 RepID=A0AAN7UVT3_9PEZI